MEKEEDQWWISTWDVEVGYIGYGIEIEIEIEIGIIGIWGENYRVV